MYLAYISSIDKSTSESNVLTGIKQVFTADNIIGVLEGIHPIE